MKINEVEQQVGITKRNIRFYEKEGLLSPARNTENGYRDYGPAEVETLKTIKLLRKLSVPLEEIRKMQRGELTLQDGVRRHVIQLERDQENLENMKRLCRRLQDANEQLPTLDAGVYLAQMEELEREGTTFMNIKKHDTLARYVGPVMAALAFAGLMAVIIALMLWGYTIDPAAAPPLVLVILSIALLAAPIIGVLIALFQRFKQIRGGEEDAAAKY